MKTIAALCGKSRRRHMRFVRDVRAGKLGAVYADDRSLYRIALRLHRAGLLILTWKDVPFRDGSIAFREFRPELTRQAASANGWKILPGSPLP